MEGNPSSAAEDRGRNRNLHWQWKVDGSRVPPAASRAPTSLRQLEANRRNALRSTGPRTENGKQQSRRNVLKHRLTAETVIEPLENPEEYRVFEEAVVSEYLPQTPVERELVHRLASLFWRLRRATSIETGLSWTGSAAMKRRFGGSSRRRCSPCKRSNTGKDRNDWSPPLWVLLVTARNDLI